jgi:hypothetical protein
MKKYKHIDTSFDDFLKEEGILEEVEAAAAKRTFLIQFEREQFKKTDGINLKKAAMQENSTGQEAHSAVF